MPHRKKNKVLFICKISDYLFGSSYCYPGRISGLRNSAGFCSWELNNAGIESKVIIVNDNNDIDREVRSYNPTHVVIEAFWVVPDKFDILQKLHPKVNWIVRIHSELPFMAGEGISIEWSIRYVKQPNVYISGNSPTLNEDLKVIIKNSYDEDLTDKVIYLPNCYHFEPFDQLPPESYDWLNVACFGAIRPLKNQLIQAVAAIDFGDHLNVPIHFHMNYDRVEQLGEPVLKNIRALFDHSPKHKLVLHEWMDHSTFLSVLSTMDIGLQVSFTETFNIVTADMVSVGIPVVASPEIYWVSNLFKVEETDREKITQAMLFAYNSSFYGLNRLNEVKLLRTAELSAEIWVDYFSQ